ncbi:glycoside hydrolase family 73 protein [Enterococcus sp. MJM12]|uniref:Glycoside hydrolase family 73 protein n=1 Tax=Candidatus Enterococcus myersii TaxID=2815322 RepID=A0ABS3H9A8_9ENTE|nr:MULTISPECIES: glycoside hydrolase family 73 protein [Enterococcus]MBO0449612.1 glycoside hydrolase family 73 protein [Enterococcus sp. MJM12]MDT2740693.1 glycoside hydrolase family 73 protein [Enterococcus canintestini]WHA10290.1 glycoside hydrolase family 73 protein [Enterococcus montenegrensis]
MSIKRKYTKRKKAGFPAILAGFLLILAAFVFSIKQLSQPTTPTQVASVTNEEVSRKEFIKKLVPHAQELQKGYGVLPSIILGQAALESNFGQSQLASEYKNLFGIKAYGDVPKVKLDTQEFVNEQYITIKGEFKVYNSWEASMDDHTMLFVNGVNWDRQKYESVLLAQDYKQAAKALQEAGYATDPQYADKIISMIEEYNLMQYD